MTILAAGASASVSLPAGQFIQVTGGSGTAIVQNMPGAASLKSVQWLDQGAPTDGTAIVTFNPGLLTQSLALARDAAGNFSFDVENKA